MMNEQTQEACVHEKDDLTCTSVTGHYADVSVPLKLKPYAIVGKPVTECCCEPVVTLRSCPGATNSCGCEITITQTVCIRIPIAYGADADAGDVTAICKKHPVCPGNCGNNCR